MKKMMGRLHKLQTEQQRAFMNEQRHLDERQQLQVVLLAWSLVFDMRLVTCDV